MFARVLVASDTTTALPVTRVALDRDFLEHISSTKDGVTVARCEEQRHSFLMPLQELGGQFFWVWAVRSGERLAALLAVAFTDAPQPDPRYATLGMEFAARLSIALSKSAHDEHLYRQAHYDPLTGLPNRVLFNQKLEADIRAAEAARVTGALLYIDLDHFKKVNDTVGHLAGDQLLSIVSQRLRAIVKEGDTVARLAGDEFMVVLPRVDGPDAASMVADRLIESLALPVSLGGRDHYVQASIGIAFFPDDGSTVEELLRNADGAMYRAKDMGRGRAVFFDRKLAISQLDPTQSGLFRALRRREFSLYYQPQFSLADGRLTGLEALLRWQTPRDGTREPRSFIPAAEASGLIVDIGGWVLEAACAQLAVWREQGIAPPRLAINVSAQQLKYTEFPRTVRRVLDKFSLSPDLLELELTETVLADQAAGAALQQLSALGVRIALDDFGTGYSSLNYLRNHPIRAVKIDRSFLEEVPLNAASATLAETIITMAHALGKEVVAEGVETEEQMQFLRERGCDMAQGFYLARPMPVVQASELLHARQDFLAPSPVRAAG
jgi:diguanylate cyclase (GGDEF)-like protein